MPSADPTNDTHPAAVGELRFTIGLLDGRSNSRGASSRTRAHSQLDRFDSHDDRRDSHADSALCASAASQR